MPEESVTIPLNIDATSLGETFNSVSTLSDVMRQLTESGAMQDYRDYAQALREHALALREAKSALGSQMESGQFLNRVTPEAAAAMDGYMQRVNYAVSPQPTPPEIVREQRFEDARVDARERRMAEAGHAGGGGTDWVLPAGVFPEGFGGGRPGGGVPSGPPPGGGWISPYAAMQARLKGLPGHGALPGESAGLGNLLQGGAAGVQALGAATEGEGLLGGLAGAAGWGLAGAAAGYAGYRMLNEVGQQYSQARAMGAYTGEGVGAGMGYNIKALATGWNPFSGVSASQAQAGMASELGAGFSGSNIDQAWNFSVGAVQKYNMDIATSAKLLGMYALEANGNIKDLSDSLDGLSKGAAGSGKSVSDLTQGVAKGTESLISQGVEGPAAGDISAGMGALTENFRDKTGRAPSAQFQSLLVALANSRLAKEMAGHNVWSPVGSEPEAQQNLAALWNMPGIQDILRASPDVATAAAKIASAGTLTNAAGQPMSPQDVEDFLRAGQGGMLGRDWGAAAKAGQGGAPSGDLLDRGANWLDSAIHSKLSWWPTKDDLDQQGIGNRIDSWIHSKASWWPLSDSNQDKAAGARQQQQQAAVVISMDPSTKGIINATVNGGNGLVAVQDYYRYQQANGQVTFGNNPTSGPNAK